MASIDEKTGQSWCPDCRDADPHIKTSIQKFAETDVGKQSLFITAHVGQRPEWKSPDCPFRGDPYLLKCVPTLIVEGLTGRLEEQQLLDAEAIIKFISRDYGQRDTNQ